MFVACKLKDIENNNDADDNDNDDDDDDDDHTLNTLNNL